MKRFLQFLTLAQPRFAKGCVGMPAHLHRYYYASFAIGIDTINSILIAVNSAFARMGVTTECRIEAFTVRGKLDAFDLARLSLFGNWWKNRLTLVRLVSRPEGVDAGVVVQFSDYSPGWSAAVIVEGLEGASASELFDKINDEVSLCHRWYSLLSGNRLWCTFMVVLWLFSVLLFVYWLLYYGLAPVTRQVALGQPGSVVGLLSVMAFGIVTLAGCAVLILILWLWSLLFPKLIFLVGQELRREENRHKGRWALATAIIAPVLVGVVTACIL